MVHVFGHSFRGAASDDDDDDDDVGKRREAEGKYGADRKMELCEEAHLAEVGTVAALCELRGDTKGTAAARAVADRGGRVRGAHSERGGLRLARADLNARLALRHFDRLKGACQSPGAVGLTQLQSAYLGVGETGVLPRVDVSEVGLRERRELATEFISKECTNRLLGENGALYNPLHDEGAVFLHKSSTLSTHSMAHGKGEQRTRRRSH